MNEKYLWKFEWVLGGGDAVEGLFVASEKQVAGLIGKEAYFGEINGKHSEVYGEIEEDDIEKVALDPKTVAKVSAVLGDTWAGYNPLNYVEEAE